MTDRYYRFSLEELNRTEDPQATIGWLCSSYYVVFGHFFSGGPESLARVTPCSYSGLKIFGAILIARHESATQYKYPRCAKHIA